MHGNCLAYPVGYLRPTLIPVAAKPEIKEFLFWPVGFYTASWQQLFLWNYVFLELLNSFYTDSHSSSSRQGYPS
jgi:hypothetical protein